MGVLQAFSSILFAKPLSLPAKRFEEAFWVGGAMGGLPAHPMAAHASLDVSSFPHTLNRLAGTGELAAAPWTRASLHLSHLHALASASAMHCVSRVPLATIGNQQQPLQLSPLKALCLAEKENTVSTRGSGRGGPGRRVPEGLGPASHRTSPRSHPPSVAPTCWPARPRGGFSGSQPSR